MNNLDYGIIGNCKSAAIISIDGSLDWCCLPDFDSSSVFAKLLDKKIGGHFSIIVDESYRITQMYIPDTNILRTRFNNGKDSFDVIDFMPRYATENKGYYSPPDVIRYFKYKSGRPKFRLDYQPKLAYARYETFCKSEEDYIKSYTEEGFYDSLYLYTNFERGKILDSEEIELEFDGFALISYNQKILAQTVKNQYLKLQRTKIYWLDWIEKTTSYQEYHDEIARSALVLKLLSYDKSGAVLAAATTSLPETIGETRNWDYRFCWIRDSSMVIKVMNLLGHENTVKRFIGFITDIISDKDSKIQIMYGINRQATLTEETLDHLEGYEGSKPVRIGNAAYFQKQNDIYGVLMDVIYHQFLDFSTDVDDCEYLWTITRTVVNNVKENWQKPDKGIWEIRNEDKHFTFSKVLCWVAIDRAEKIARLIHKYEIADKWHKLADKIKEDVLTHAWNEELQTFTQSYGSTNNDAANLLMEPYGFISAKDPKYINMVKSVEKELLNDGLMYRYRNEDDFGTPKSSFTICTFWIINALNAIGQKLKAREMFERLLSYSNHLDLFSEDIDFETKRLLGNFPQAYSHLALIETAINLSKGDLTEEEQVVSAISR